MFTFLSPTQFAQIEFSIYTLKVSVHDKMKGYYNSNFKNVGLEIV